MAHTNYIEPRNPGQRSLFHRLGVVEAEIAEIERKANAGSLVRVFVELARVCGTFMKRYRGLPRLPTDAMLSDWRALLEASEKARDRVEPFLAEHGAAHADSKQLRPLQDFFAWVPRHVSAIEKIHTEMQQLTKGFIEKHQLAAIIDAAKSQVTTAFQGKATPIVELDIDPETGSQYLYVVAETELNIEDTQAPLKDLDAWWLSQAQTGAPMSVTVRHI